jgi:hypothetical protein
MNKQIADAELYALPIVAAISCTDTTTDTLSRQAIACIWYKGATGSGATFAIAAGGDWAFTTDGTTADTTISTDGTIDLSTPDASENTWGEVCDVVNASPNWGMYLLAVLPEDSTDNTSETQVEIDLSTAAMKKSGFFVYGDSSVTFETAVCISGFQPTGVAGVFEDDDNCVNWVNYVLANANFDSGTCAVKIYSANQHSSVLIYTGAAMTTDTNSTHGTNGDLGFMPSKYGERLVVKIDASADLDIYTLSVIGKCVDLKAKHIKTGFDLTNYPTA